MKKMIRIFALCLLCLMILTACSEKTTNVSVSGRKNLSGIFVDSGYYHTDSKGFLKYTELSDGTTVCLCQKVGCTHENTDICEGYIGTTGGIVGTALLYWNHGLYYFQTDEYGTHLYRRNSDGTGLSAVSTLCKSYMEELEEINFSVLDGIIFEGKLYYFTIIFAVVENEDGTSTTEPIIDLINCVDLQTGKEETLIKSEENRLELVDVQNGNLYYLEMEQGDTSAENYGDTVDSLPIWLKKYDLSKGEYATVFEKKRADYASTNTLLDDKLYYHINTEAGNENHCYDIKDGTDILISMDRLTILNNRYILRRPQKGLDWEILDMQSKKVLPCDFAGEHLSLQNVSDKGAVFKRTEMADGMSTGQNEYFYVTFKSLSDGLQKSDCILIQ